MGGRFWRPWMNVATTTKPTAMRKNAVPMTLTWTGTPIRADPQMKIGNVFVRPAVNEVIT